MATVTDAAIRSTAWEVLFDALAAGSYSSSTAPGVYRNNSDIDDNNTFPRIILYPLSVSQSNSAFGRARTGKTIQVLIDIWAQKNKDLDLIGDEVVGILSTTSFTGLQFIGTEDALTLETDVNQKLHLRTLTATFMRG